MNLPYLPPWYRIAAGSAKVVVEYGQRIVCFEGAAAELLLPVLLPLLDGMRTVEEIVVMLGEPARPAVENALARLVDHGLLVEEPGVGRDPRVGGVLLLHLACRLDRRVVGV